MQVSRYMDQKSRLIVLAAAAALVDAPIEYEDEGFVAVSEELPFEF